MSLLLVVFFLQLAIHLVNTVGASSINALLWDIYNRLPTPTSKAAAEQKELQREYLKIKKELNATSSQDQFAKWAKLRRQHDKQLEQLEKIKSSLDSTKSMFDKIVGALRFLGTTGLRMLLQFWFSKQPIFWLPQGWVPYYAEWLLSFPRAPLGSVSIQAWGVACSSVILLVSDAIVALVGLVMTSKGATVKEKRKEAPIPTEASTQPEKSESKKEL